MDRDNTVIVSGKRAVLEALRAGEVGEVVVRGPVVSRAYAERPEATAAAKLDWDGRLAHRMGDLASLKLYPALTQLAIFALTSSVALLADLVHNFGDALTAVPLGIAFFLRSFRAEKIAGLAVVLAIFVSACVALYETIQRLFNPEDLTHLWALAAAGLIGFAGNELAAQVRLRAGRRLSSPALVADGNHARTDGFVSLGVVASAILVALGFPLGDPLVGLVITLVIFKITWDSWRLVSTTEPAFGSG